MFSRGVAVVEQGRHQGVRFAIRLAIVSWLSGASVMAQESTWDRFRGPNGSGIQEDRNLPSELDAKGALRWRTELPPGHSSPVFHGDRVFLTAVDGEALRTICLNAKTGQRIWSEKAPRDRVTKIDSRNNDAAPSAVVDDDVVVVFFGDFGLLAYDHAGKEQWRLPLGPFDNLYGIGASPILVGDRVVLAIDQNRDSHLLAVAKKDGQPIWRTKRERARSGHSTPIVLSRKGGRTEIVLPGSFQLDAYDAETGERAWWTGGLCWEMKSVPVVHDGVVYIHGYGSPLNNPGNQVRLDPYDEVLRKHDADENGRLTRNEMPPSRAAGYFKYFDLDEDGALGAAEWNYLRSALLSKNGLVATRIGDRGDVTKSHFVWSYHRAVPQLPSPLVYRNVLYMLNDQGGLVTLLDPKTGKVLKRGRLENAIDNYYASPIAGDGKVYFVGLSGVISVVEASNELTTRSTRHLNERCFATPAIYESCLYVRSEKALYCFAKPSDD